MWIPVGSSGYGPRPLCLPRRSLHRDRLELRRCRSATSNDRRRVGRSVGSRLLAGNNNRNGRACSAQRDVLTSWRTRRNRLVSILTSGLAARSNCWGSMLGQIDVVQCEMTWRRVRRSFTPGATCHRDDNEPSSPRTACFFIESKGAFDLGPAAVDTAPENKSGRACASPITELSA